ncbi:MAG: hypothetical protein VR64_22310 [Desulfatitalea sp. BRH_c12]|nr:MAG: hypothetical protein VR64_22310 [Desulfatitalea sp. BRH_c12]
MKELIPFQFEGKEIQVITDEKGDPWFVAKDVCAVLGFGNPYSSLALLEDDEKQTIHSVEGLTSSRNSNVVIINEPGLYSLILRSRKPEAKVFKKWVTHDVLPAIRKTGGYIHTTPEMSDDEIMAKALLVAHQKIADRERRLSEVEAEVVAMQPKVEALGRIADADGSACLTDAAKVLQLRRIDLISWMVTHGWVYRRPGCQHILGYQEKIQQGVLTNKVSTYEKRDGSEGCSYQVRVTAKGLTRLAQLMASCLQAA